MFHSKTVFVVGAGASHEVNLPTGKALAGHIETKLNFEHSPHKTLQSGDPVIYETLYWYSAKQADKDREMKLYMRAAKQVRDAMPQVSSIDSFIDTHAGNRHIELCGKLAIVQTILDEEKKSKLFYNQRDGSWYAASKDIQNTWHQYFFEILADDCRLSNLHAIFDNISFIVFNYDRCIEHFLIHALQTRFTIDALKAEQIIGTLKIIHPYGVVGCLPWQGMGVKVPFGGRARQGENLLSLSRQIKTFTEYEQDVSIVSEIRRLVQGADTIVFLGFAFHPQNMELLKVTEKSIDKTIYSTTSGISKNDARVVRKKIAESFAPPGTRIYINKEYDLKCFELFREFRRTLQYGSR